MGKLIIKTGGKSNMRTGAKRMIWALCAGPAIAATLIAGSSAASASVPVSNSGIASGPHGPGHPNCNRWQLERWNLNGSNTITAIYNNAPFHYTITFQQDGSCLTGTLADPNISSNLPKSGPISGTIRGNDVTFSFTYPGNIQGTRTYTGTIDRHGAVAGNWSDSLDHATGTWSLGTNANRACPRFWWWNPRRECFVRSH